MYLSDLFQSVRNTATPEPQAMTSSTFFRSTKHSSHGSLIPSRMNGTQLSILLSKSKESIENDENRQQNGTNLYLNNNNNNNTIDQLKRTVRQSLQILNKPKTGVYGSRSKQKLQSYTQQQDANQQLLQQHYPGQHHQQPIQSSNGFSKSLMHISRPDTTTTGSALDQVPMILRTRKIGSSDWLGLHERVDEELAQKHPQFYSSLSQQSLQPPPSRGGLSSSSLQERVKEFNNGLYMKVVSAKSTGSSHQLNSLHEIAGQKKKPAASTSQSTHQIMSSLCLAQIKPIRGGKVQKSDKTKLQHYYDSVSERLHDFRQTRVSGGKDGELELDLNKIKYEPVNAQKGSNSSTYSGGSSNSIGLVRQLYLNGRMKETQADLLRQLAESGGQQQHQPQLETIVDLDDRKKQQREQKYTREYKRKTFFVMNRNYGQENNLAAAKKDNVENDFALDEKRMWHDESAEKERKTNNDLEGEQDKQTEGKTSFQRFKRVRKELCELLKRHYFLGLSIDEAKKEGVFTREPFKREGAHVFFRFVKANNIEMVEKMLEKDKYLVHDFDHTLQSPLHWAAKRGMIEVAQALLKNGADVNCTDGLGRTPLLFAYRDGHNAMGKLLLLNKATPWSTKRNPLDAMINSRITNDMTTIKVARQIHLTMKMAKLENQKKIWEDSRFLFEDKKFIKSKKK